MKVIPYLRFIWAAYIIITSLEKFDVMFSASGFLAVLSLLVLVMIGTFVLYCIVVGIQEVKDKQYIDARFFYFFGLVFEILLLMAGAFIAIAAVKAEIDVWNLTQFVLSLGILTLFVWVDTKRIFYK